MRKQSGLSTIGVLYVVGTLGIIGTLSIKLIPEYIEYFQLRSIFNKVSAESGLRKKDPRDIQTLLSKRIQVSSIHDFDFNQDAFVGLDDDVLVLEFKYTREAHIVANIDVRVTFEYTKEID